MVESTPIVDPTARSSYDAPGLGDDLPAAPLELLASWYAAAEADERIGEPAAMILATVDDQGRPDARTVLLKGLDASGATLFTNLDSAKGRQLAAHPDAAMVLPWHPMYRQVRLRGPVIAVSREESEAYFATRPRGSQISARASHQSQPIGSRAALQALVEAEQRRWPDTGSPDDVPLPTYWGGFRLHPVEVEFWVGQSSRLHDRIRYAAAPGTALDDPSGWTRVRLQP